MFLIAPSPYSGEFRVYEDTQLVQQDLNLGVHVYVHYFTLYDVRARGFVRPMCLSYISSDYQKLLHYFSLLKQKFTAVSVIIVGIALLFYLFIHHFSWVEPLFATFFNEAGKGSVMWELI